MNIFPLAACACIAGATTTVQAHRLDHFHKLSVKDRVRYTMLSDQGERSRYLDDVLATDSPGTTLKKRKESISPDDPLVFSIKPLTSSALVSAMHFSSPPTGAVNFRLSNPDFVLTGDPGWFRKKKQPEKITKHILNKDEWKALVNYVYSCSYSLFSPCLTQTGSVKDFDYIKATMKVTGSGAHGKFIEARISRHHQKSLLGIKVSTDPGSPSFLKKFKNEAGIYSFLSKKYPAHFPVYLGAMVQPKGSGLILSEVLIPASGGRGSGRQPDFSIENVLTLLGGIHSMHKSGILHRDIKPGNLLLTHSGQIKIGDFGESLPLKNIARTGYGVVGSSLYMAPEVLKMEVDVNNKELLEKTDAYSTGCYLFELKTGRKLKDTGGHLRTLSFIYNEIKKGLRHSYMSKHLNSWDPVDQIILDMVKDDPKERISVAVARERFLDLQIAHEFGTDL